MITQTFLSDEPEMLVQNCLASCLVCGSKRGVGNVHPAGPMRHVKSFALAQPRH